MRPLRLLAILAALAAPGTRAATTVALPSWACDANQSLFRSGFQDGERIPSDPSHGSGGIAPGKTFRTLHLAGLAGGSQNYYVYAPPDYTPSRPWPLLLALHGSGAYGSQENNAATTRDNWSSMAQSRHFLVAAPVASAEVWSGGVDYSTWLVPPVAGLSDYDLLAAVVADMEGAYNVDRARLYGWGFSAGAHVMHDLMLGSYSPQGVDANAFAAYGVSAGGLQQLVCSGVSDAACSTFLSGATRKIPLDIHLGSTDPLYTSYGAGDDPTILANAGWVNGQNLFYTLMSGTGHSYDGNQLAHIWINICPFAVEP
jgi:poly(3-hydroxybutyrate) depolymerase